MSDDAPVLSLLPPSRSLLEAGLDIAFAKLLERLDPPFPALMNPADTPVDFLPYLAADRGVSEWDSAASEAEARATVASAWALARLGGTKRALELAIESLGLVPEVVAWHNMQGEPYSLRIRAFAPAELSSDILGRLRKRINYAKAERDYFELEIGSQVSGKLFLASSSITGSVTCVYPLTEPLSEVSGIIYYCAALSASSITTVWPDE